MAIGVDQKKVTVTTAGTAVVFNSTTLYTYTLIVYAPTSNTGAVHIGDADVDSSSDLGIALQPGESVTFSPPQSGGHDELWDLNKLYVDALNNDDLVSITYTVRV